MDNIVANYQAYQQTVYRVCLSLFVLSGLLVMGWYLLPWVSRRYLAIARSLYWLVGLGLYGLLLVQFLGGLL